MPDTARPISVLLVEDHLVMATALRLLLSSQAHLRVVGTAANRPEALAIAQATPPDIVLLDLFLADGLSLDWMPEMLASTPHSRVLVLTGTPDVQLHRRALSLGVRGLVLKEQPAEVLIKAIERVHDGEVWVDASLMSLLAQTSPTTAQDLESIRIATLTPRELEIIGLIAQGCKNKPIADRLFISERTVHNHLASIFRKLEVSDRLELAVFAGRHKLGAA